MKKPSFQFYPADWRNNAKLRRCTWEARGAWLEVMCLLHDSEEYGLLRWSLKELAQAIGAPLKLLKELVDKGVLKGGDKTHEALIYTPRSGRVDGDPITLIVGESGACWYSSRMVIDEHVRQKKGESTRFPASPNPSPKGGIGEGLNASPNPSPIGRQGDGSTSSSTTTYKNKDNNPPHIPSAREGDDDAENPKTTPVGEICKALKAAGLQSVSPNHPELLALIAKGITREQFIEAAQAAKGKRSPFAYMLTVVKGQLADANAIDAAPGMPDTAWDLNGSTIRAKAAELGMAPWEGDNPSGTKQPEPFASYTERVRATIDAKKGQP